ncbi:hypothetical protein AB0H71_07990 [Nocardia sp. NPDC050697]|uniref:hypothetical protein n=1 Tax=Nocardia sp. NPDC050697 TaxID=3155158 RepID=UPI0033C50F6F
MDGDPEVFYECSRRCLRTADQLAGCFEKLKAIVTASTGAAGTDGVGREWGGRHDAAADELLDFLHRSAIPALDRYAALLTVAGYNHALADHRATHSPESAAPVRPELPAERGLVPPAPITTGMGTGHGVVDNGVGFADMVGPLVTDADKEEVADLATAWRNAGETEFTDDLFAALSLVREVDADDARASADDLNDLIAVIGSCRRRFAELAAFTADHSREVVALRETRLPRLILANAAALGGVEVTPHSRALEVRFRAGIPSASLTAFTRLVLADLNDWKALRLPDVERFAAEDLGEPRRITDDINSRPIAEVPDPVGGSTTPDPAARTVRDRAGAEEVLGRDAVRIKKSSSIIYSKDGGAARAEYDFAIVSQGYDVRTYDNGARSVTLEDGSNVTLRPSSDGRVTVSIQPPTGSDRKYRYNP